MFFRPRAILFQLIVLLAFGLSACGSLFGTPATPTPAGPTSTPQPPTATPEPAAATVNGEIIAASEFQAELARYKSAQQALGRTVSDQEAGKAVLEDLIAQVLLEQGAITAGFELPDAALQSRIDALATRLGGAQQLSVWETAHGYDDSAFRRALKRSIASAWMRDKITAEVPGTADQVHVQQILLYNSVDAQALLNRLKGGEDFARLAAVYDPNTHGELGWFPKGYLLDPKIEEAAFALQPGGISDVIQTDVGFHIIKVLERDAQHPLSPDARLTLQEQALKNWIDQQRAQAAIVIAPY